MGMNYFWSQKRQRPQNYRRQSANRLSLQISKWYPQLSLAPPPFLCIPASRSLAREATTPVMGSMNGFYHNMTGISTASNFEVIKVRTHFLSVILVSQGKKKDWKTLILQAFQSKCPLFKFAKPKPFLYNFVCVFWFYLALFLSNCPVRMVYLNWCYHFVISRLLSFQMIPVADTAFRLSIYSQSPFNRFSISEALYKTSVTITLFSLIT